jgi:hypothetical protein
MPSFNLFISMSEELCGIPAFYLCGTGYAHTYLDTVLRFVGASSTDRLLATYAALPSCCQQDREAAIRADLLSHDELGPVARNVIKLWYTAIWFELPREWHRNFNPAADDRTFVPSAYAYPEALLGPAVGAHPAGAKPTGHQSWVSPPVCLPFAKLTAPTECRNAK